MKAKAVEVGVEPSVLVWARTSLGMTIPEAARSSHLGEPLIEALEGGTARLDISMLKALASAYKRSTAALLLLQPPVEPSVPEDFRTLPREETLPLSKKTRLAMRRARRLQAIARELKGRPGTLLSDRVGEIGLVDDREDAARRLRDVLDVPFDVQVRWKDAPEAFNGWRTALERLNVLVLKLPMDMTEARAFSFVEDDLPVIAINSNDSPNGMIFSLLHELGHLALHNGGLCIPARTVTWEFGSPVPEEKGRVEVFCNHMAGAILVPREQLMGQPLVKHTEHPREWSNRELDALAKVFHASREVVLRRVLYMGKTSTAFYARKHEEWSEGREPTGPRGGGGGRRIPRECVSQHGRPFVSLVLESYRNERITYNDVADYLNVKVKHIRAIEKLIEAR